MQAPQIPHRDDLGQMSGDECHEIAWDRYRNSTYEGPRNAINDLGSDGLDLTVTFKRLPHAPPSVARGPMRLTR